jgi:mono/diheme cytochrome c family protein
MIEPHVGRNREFVLGFVTALIVLAIAAVAVAYSGFYNVAAGAQEPGILQWFLTTTMHRSVKNHAQEVSAPGELTDHQAREGFRIYRDTCVYCHGAPQQDPGDIGKGLNPKAPYLPDTVPGWTTAQLFWIVKNGIKMTGMASYGEALKDDEIWNVVAFVRKLPELTHDQYEQLEQEVPE